MCVWIGGSLKSLSKKLLLFVLQKATVGRSFENRFLSIYALERGRIVSISYLRRVALKICSLVWRCAVTTTGTHCYGYLCTHHGGNLVWTRPYGALVRWGCDAIGAQWVAGTDREETRVQCRGRKTARRVRPSAVAEVNRELGERPRAHVLGNIPWVFTRPKRWR